MLLRKALVSDRVIEDYCLLVIVLWHDNPHVYVHAWYYCFSEKPTKQGLLLIALYTVDVYDPINVFKY